MTHIETDDSALPANTPVMRTRALADSPTLAAKAVQFLSERQFSFGLEKEDAQCVVPYLRLVSFASNTFLYREGDSTKTSYMLLLLEGDVSVDTGASGRADRVAISVLGPGALIGEMALLDGAPRSTSCTAVTPVQAAGMSQGGLELLNLVQKRDQVQRTAAQQFEFGPNAGQFGIGRVPDVDEFVFEINLQLAAQEFA